MQSKRGTCPLAASTELVQCSSSLVASSEGARALNAHPFSHTSMPPEAHTQRTRRFETMRRFAARRMSIDPNSSQRLYYIELIGLKGLQPYAPLRVLRQFGQEQIIPLQANMRVSEIQFGSNFIIPRARKIFDEWNDIDKMDIGDSQAGCTPEYH
ncbi:hypothetical protein RND71_018533 [Anisodus tanguticus]|uniref:Uncharacterized protein n=1 Tax=Anisodus tanguticus TaxID=243964 RepID=A0AAE1VC63_9SOLA|nr:hypothetical protein RND71_018533 [Anisodus tanguticus]